MCVTIASPHLKFSPVSCILSMRMNVWGGMLPGTDTGPASHGMCAGVYPLQARESDKKIRGGNTPLAANFSACVSLKFR